jgi:glycine/D-amino acid oxidase-like deaminating enzyme
MTDRHDVVIVGGGVIGSAVASFLAADPAFDGRVLVVERDPTYREASSALSASSIRQQFSTPENIAMSRFGFEFLRLVDRHLGIEGTSRPVEVGLMEHGYLYLAGQGGAEPLREAHAVQRSVGAEVELLEPDELAARFGWLSTAGVAIGSLGLAGEGWFDGFALLTAFRQAAVARDVAYVAAEVVGLGLDGHRVVEVRLADGRTLGCGVVVDAAGPWAGSVAAMAGVALPVEARRRVIHVFDAAPLSRCPLVIDPTGLWFRPEGTQFLCGTSPPADADRVDLPLEVGPADIRDFEERLWPVLAARVPAFDTLRLRRSWAGYYEYDTFDQNAILGSHPEIGNLLFANGFSGHGIQQAPAVGRAIAELIVHGRYLSLDLSAFGFERIAAGRRVVERHVIG